jgi:hypothetical protein
MVSQGSEFNIGKSWIYYLPTYLPTNNMPVSCNKVGSKKKSNQANHTG